MIVPYVSVCIITYNEEKNIEKVLSSVIHQNYPRDRFEILVVDSGSTDSTVDIVKKMALNDTRIHLYDSGKQSISLNRNIGLNNARGELIAYIDADCIAPEDWLETLVLGYEKYSRTTPNLAGVGGYNILPDEGSWFERILGLFLRTYFGTHGSPQGKILDKDQVVRHLPTVNVLYDKRKVQEVGGFDLRMHNIIEDEDLSTRLAEKGYQLMYLKDSYVYHYFCANYREFIKKMFVYGKGRAWYMRKHFGNTPKILIGPALLVIGLILTPLGSMKKLFLLPLIYFPFIFLVSLYETTKVGRPLYTFGLFLIYLTAHLTYGVGEIYGLLKGAPAYGKEVR